MVVLFRWCFVACWVAGHYRSWPRLAFLGGVRARRIKDITTSIRHTAQALTPRGSANAIRRVSSERFMSVSERATNDWKPTASKSAPWKPVGWAKYQTFQEYARMYQEYSFVFLGDNGQGDVLAGELVRTLVAVNRRARTNDALCTAYTVPYVRPDDGG